MIGNQKYSPAKLERKVIIFVTSDPPFHQKHPFAETNTLTQVLPCEYCENFKNSFFTEHLWLLPLFHEQREAIVCWHSINRVNKTLLKVSLNSIENTCSEVSFFNKVLSFLLHSNFPVSFAKFLRTPILLNIFEQLLPSRGASRNSNVFVEALTKYL